MSSSCFIRSLLLFLFLALLLTGPTAQAVGGYIGVYVIPEEGWCSLRDQVPGLTNYFVVANTGDRDITTRSITFSAPKPECSTMEYLQDSHHWPMTTGNSQTEVSITYNTCQPAGPIVLTTIHFWGYGTTPPCCMYGIMPVPSVGFARTVDCDGNELEVTRLCHAINSDPTCRCGRGFDFCPEIVPVEPSTWGRVKALYAE